MESYNIWRQYLKYFWASACLILFNMGHVCTCQCKMLWGGSLFSGHTVYIASWRPKTQKRSENRELNQASRSTCMNCSYLCAVCTIIIVSNTVTQRQFFFSIFPSSRSTSRLRCGQVEVRCYRITKHKCSKSSGVCEKTKTKYSADTAPYSVLDWDAEVVKTEQED